VLVFPSLLGQPVEVVIVIHALRFACVRILDIFTGKMQIFVRRFAVLSLVGTDL
jgi:hypothetical protein